MSTEPEPTSDDRAPRRRRRARGDERGIALLLVLSSIALMTIIVVDFQEEQTSDLHSALAERDAMQAEYMARSAVNLSRLFVASEPVMRQSLGILRLLFGGKAVPQLPVWEFSDVVLGAFSDKEGQEGFQRLGGFDLGKAKNLGGPEGSSFKVVVVDEDAKININLGARGNIIAQNRFGASFLGLTGAPAFDRLFERNDRDGNTSDRVTICGALMDWADPDEVRYMCDPRNFQGGGGSSGEDSSYQMLKRPYRPKNAPYDSLDEAHLVRGIGDDFWATFVDPDPSNPKKRIMTVWGQGPINVNTAHPQAVLAVVCGLARPDTELCIDEAKKAQFLVMFGVLRSFTSGMPLFGAPQEFIATLGGAGMYGKMLFEGLGLKPIAFQSPAEAAKNFTTESKVFSIYATGEMVGYRRTTRILIHAVVDFRGAPAIPNSVLPGGMPPQPGQPGAVPPGQTAPVNPQGFPGQMPGMPMGAGVDAIGGALVPNPAGTIVYYRIE